MNFENFNFNSLDELTFGELINSEASAEQFVIQNKLVSLLPPPVVIVVPKCGLN